MADQLPYSQEIEEALLARLLLDPRQLPVVAARLKPDDFYVGAYRRAYAEMLRLSQAGRAVDVSVIQAGTGERLDITHLSAAHRAPLDEYVEAIRQYAFRRRMIGVLDNLTRQAYACDDPESLLAQTRDAMQSLTEGLGTERLLTPDQAVDAYLRELHHKRAGFGRGLAYGIVPLDRIVQPAQGGDLIILAARPAMGKTMLAEMIADSWAADAAAADLGTVLFCSLEMSVEQLFDRAVSRHTKIPAAQVTRSQLNDEEIERVRQAAEARRSINITYLDQSFVTTADIRAAAATLRLQQRDPAAIVVDYLQLLQDPGDSDVQRVGRISRQLKAIAREMDVPVLALSQLNRSSMMREDPHPRLHDLRDSGSLEQDADVVLGLYRPENAPTQLDLDVLKNRQGQVGRVPLVFDPDHVGVHP